VVGVVNKLALTRACYPFFKIENTVSDNLAFSNRFSTPQNANNAEISSSQGDLSALLSSGVDFAIFYGLCSLFTPQFKRNNHVIVAVSLFLWLTKLLWMHQSFKQKHSWLEIRKIWQKLEKMDFYSIKNYITHTKLKPI